MILEIYLAAATLVLMGIAALLGLAPRSNRSLVFGLALLALLALLAAVAYRWVQVGHAPIFGTFEAGTGAALCGLSLALVLLRRAAVPAAAPAILLLFSAAFLAYGFAFSTQRIPLTISELSLWTDLHAGLAYLALALLAGSSAAALPQFRAEPQPALDALTYRLTMLGFILLSLMIAAGSYYESILFGTAWSWDPVETFALISWLGYGIIIHMRLFYGWRDRRFAILAVIAFVILVAAYKLMPLLPGWLTFHHFDLEF